MSPLAADAAVKGSKPFTAKLSAGGSETVVVRALGVREFERYLSMLDNEPEVAELLCDKPAGWSDKLDPNSLGELVQFGEAVNEPFFRPWVIRRMERKERLLKGIQSTREAQSSSSTNSSQT